MVDIKFKHGKFMHESLGISNERKEELAKLMQKSFLEKDMLLSERIEMLTKKNLTDAEFIYLIFQYGHSVGSSTSDEVIGDSLEKLEKLIKSAVKEMSAKGDSEEKTIWH